MIASIAISAAVYAIDKPYSYKIPEDMRLSPGFRVIVPFGRGNRRSEGIILSITEGNEEGLKAIDRVLDETPVLTQTQIRMAAFIRERYFCTFYDAIKAMLPAGLWFRTQERLSLCDVSVDPDSLSSSDARRIVQLLLENGGTVEMSFLQTAILDGAALENGLCYLKRKKMVASNVDFNRRVQDKTEKIASLAVSAEETMEYANRKIRSAPMQYEVLKLLCAIGSGSTKEICYLTGANMATIRRLNELGYLELSVRDVFRNSLPEHVDPAEPLILNEAQNAVFEGLSLQHTQERPGVALIHGVTGSGKTAVYIRMIEKTLQQGRSAIMLVPEIALTPQLLQLLMAHFGREVAVLHSALLAQDSYALDIRNLSLRKELWGQFLEVTGVPYRTRTVSGGKQGTETEIFDCAALPRDCDWKELSLRLSKAIREQGYRLLYLPERRIDL